MGGIVLTRKELRANRARVVGNILPVYSEMMKTHNYETFNALQEEDGTATFRKISTGLRNLYALYHLQYNISNLANWICEHPRSGTGLTGANLKKAFIASDGSVNMGRGYLTVYGMPILSDPPNDVNPDEFTFSVDVSFDSDYAYALLGFLNSAGDNVNPGISKKLSNLVSYANRLKPKHTLEYKYFEGMLYLFVDGWYTGQYLEVDGQVRDLMCAFYMGSASSNYTGVQVYEMHMLPRADFYPYTYLNSNVDVWVRDKVKSGTSVAEANRVSPYVNEDTGRMNAGRGYCVYMSKGIFNPYNQDLKDRFTVTCNVYCDDGLNQEVLFGQLNTDGTDITGAFKTSIASICEPDDLGDVIRVEYRGLNGDVYLFVNGRYTGHTRETTGINWMLGMYNAKALSGNDGVEMNNVTVRNTCSLYPYVYQFRNLSNWVYEEYVGNTATLSEPSIIDENAFTSVTSVGSGYYAYLNAPVKLYDNVDYIVTLSFDRNNQHIGFGRISFVNSQIKPTGIDVVLYDLTRDNANPHTLSFKMLDMVAYLFLDDRYTGVSYDFGDEGYNVFLGLYNGSSNGSLLVRNVEAVRGTLTSVPVDAYLLLSSVNWASAALSNAAGTPEENTYAQGSTTLGRYRRNLYKVPFHRTHRYTVRFTDGSNAYMALANRSSNPGRWESVQVSTANGFNVGGGENLVVVDFDGEYIQWNVNNGTQTHRKRLPIEYGQDLYLGFWQNNANNPVRVYEIVETVLPACWTTPDDWTREDIGFDGSKVAMLTSTGIVLGKDYYYYNNMLEDGHTYEIHFTTTTGDTFFGLVDTLQSINDGNYETQTEKGAYDFQDENGDSSFIQGEENVLLIKLNGGRISWKLNNSTVIVDHLADLGMPTDYGQLYLYTQPAENITIHMIREHNTTGGN